jgi:hypothetical protein
MYDMQARSSEPNSLLNMPSLATYSFMMLGEVTDIMRLAGKQSIPTYQNKYSCWDKTVREIQKVTAAVI